MTHANIDSDIFRYSFGSCKTDEGHPLAWPLVATRLNAQIRNILDATGATSHTLYLTGPGNFRERTATIRPYKGTRPTEKPYWYEAIGNYLIKFRGAVVIEGMEADDALSINQTEKTVLCSIDKDLDMVPGSHYNWVRDKLYELSDTECSRNFYCQLLTGDSVDNIPGLFGVGKSSTHVKHILTLCSELDMLDYTLMQYEKRFGRYGWGFLEENGILLWMLRGEPEDMDHPEREIISRLGELRRGLCGQSWKRRLLVSLNSAE